MIPAAARNFPEVAASKQEQPQDRSSAPDRATELEQLLMRQVNERIAELNEQWESRIVSDESPLELRCECMRHDCRRTFLMPADVFRRVRRSPELYILSSEHSPTLREELVESGDGYVVVRQNLPLEAVADP